MDWTLQLNGFAMIMVQSYDKKDTEFFWASKRTLGSLYKAVSRFH